jgi:hypothetical protein
MIQKRSTYTDNLLKSKPKTKIPHLFTIYLSRHPCNRKAIEPHKLLPLTAFVIKINNERKHTRAKRCVMCGLVGVFLPLKKKKSPKDQLLLLFYITRKRCDEIT